MENNDVHIFSVVPLKNFKIETCQYFSKKRLKKTKLRLPFFKNRDQIETKIYCD